MKNRERLPHVFAGISLAVFIVLGLASASPPTAANPLQPSIMFPDAIVLGTVDAIFESNLDSALAANIDRLNQIAISTLREAARREHGDLVEVTEITWSRFGLAGGRHQYSASGTVVALPGFRFPGLEGALGRTVEDLARYFPAGSRIAIAHIVAADRGYADLIDGRLEHLFRIRGFNVFDRSQLDIVRAEQQLGLDFVIDERTAVSIGRLTGVSVIITSRVVVAGNLRELQIRAVDTTTARLIGTALEQF